MNDMREGILSQIIFFEKKRTYYLEGTGRVNLINFSFFTVIVPVHTVWKTLIHNENKKTVKFTKLTYMWK
jgi:hypothetical protein